jgi:hypothetical protein
MQFHEKPLQFSITPLTLTRCTLGGEAKWEETKYLKGRLKARFDYLKSSGISGWS